MKGCFNIKTEFMVRPMKKHGFLGYIMSPYDPFNIGDPTVLSWNLPQLESFPPKPHDPLKFNDQCWDDPITNQFEKQRKQMTKTWQEVQKLTMSLSNYPKVRGNPLNQQIFAFVDASDPAFCMSFTLGWLRRTSKLMLHIYVVTREVYLKVFVSKGDFRDQG